MSILSAAKTYETSRPDVRLLMENDSSKSLAVRTDRAPNPSDLRRYQERFLATLETIESTENDWLPAVCNTSKPHIEDLLERWTRLRQFHERIRDEERYFDAQRRESLQPTVESDSDNELAPGPHMGTNSAKLTTPIPRRSGSVQPLFTEPILLAPEFGPSAPPSPVSSYGVSPRNSGHNLASATTSPVSPRTSISSLPVKAAAAVEAKDQDNELNLEIPWKIYTHKCYWEYIDAKMVGSNTDLPLSTVASDRNCWTEIHSSWVCKEAIREAEYKFTQVRKERQDGGRTRLETCFCIEQPLKFEEIQHLVERTVEIYRRTQPPTPPPPTKRRTSTERMTRPHLRDRDRDKTPIANQHPPLERSTTYAYPPPPPLRTLGRTYSMPGPSSTFPPASNAPNIQPNPPYLRGPSSPLSPHPPQPGTGPALYPPHMLYPSPFSPSLNPPNYPQSPLRPFHSTSRNYDGNNYPSTSTTSDSDTARRARKHRSSSRRSSTNSKKKHSTVSTLATVGGLAALLDGIVDLGVL